MLRAALALFVVIVLSSAALAERRVALVFGADEYRQLRPLANAVNDAREVEDVLRHLGFEVFAEQNRDLRRMRRALDDFVTDAAGADVALVFFAGHGVEIGGYNRLLPVDADASSLERLDTTSLPLDEVRKAVAAVAPIVLIILDACRDDPFGATAAGETRGAATLVPPLVQEMTRPGLGRMGRSENVLFAFAAAPGETAADGAGDHSPFTSALAKYLPTDGLEIRSVLTLVQQEVYDLSGGTQLPYVESGLPAMFFAAQTGVIPERERLLLAMADVTPAVRDEVEAVAAAHSMPLAPLYAALVENELSALPAGERAAKLAESAAAFVKVREELRGLSASDPQVAALRQEAERQLSLGAVEAALGRLEEAAAADASSRETLRANYVQRTLSEAATHFIAGGTARTDLRYQRAIKDYGRAAALYEEFRSEDITDADWLRHYMSYWRIAELNRTVGDTVAATAAYEKMHDIALIRTEIDPDNPARQRDLAASYHWKGAMNLARGDVAGARAAFESARDIGERETAAAPYDPEWLKTLAVAHGSVGDAMMRQGDLGAALAAYNASHAAIMRLSVGDQDDSEALNTLSVAHQRTGQILVARGDLSGAFEAYRLGAEVAERLATSDPRNMRWQRGLAVSLSTFGDVRLARGDLAGALNDHEASREIIARLASLDPENANHQRDLAATHENVGKLRAANGDLDGAGEDYGRMAAIMQSLVELDPENADWQRDLSISYDRIGSVRMAQRRHAEALSAYELGLSISKQLAARDAENAEWQRGLSISQDRVGDVRAAKGDFQGALLAYEESLAIRERLVARDAGIAARQHDLAVSHSKVGDMHLAQRNHEAALSAYEAGFAVAQRLAALDPGNVDWRRGLVVSLFKLAQAGSDAQANLQRALDIALAMQENGTLAPSDAFIPDMLRAELQKLDSAIAAE